MFEQFFVGKATEHLLGAGVRAEHLNDDRLGRVLDALYLGGLNQLFMSIGLTHLVDVNASEDPPGYRHPPYQGG